MAIDRALNTIPAPSSCGNSKLSREHDVAATPLPVGTGKLPFDAKGVLRGHSIMRTSYVLKILHEKFSRRWIASPIIRFLELSYKLSDLVSLKRKDR